MKTVFVCNECGAETSKWSGQCSSCNVWNSIEEQQIIAKDKHANKRYAGFAAATTTNAIPLHAVDAKDKVRHSLGCSEFDRVLGGGIVAGSVIMLGGDPGIGKTTLLLQNLAAQNDTVLYVSGEESLEQIGLRAQQIKLQAQDLLLLCETSVPAIISQVQQHKPHILVVDSIQTVYQPELQSIPGSVSQVRECAMALVQLAKKTATTIFLIGHVTKEGSLAGPRVLEHMVDTVLYFEGEINSRFRLIRAVKNRFGAVGELGVFAMTDSGLKAVTNPSAIFLAKSQQAAPGSIVTVAWEGTRPLLLEVQALVDDGGSAKRLSLGLDNNRVAMMLALVHRYLGINIHNQDIFVNIVGGIKLAETSADLAIVAALLSSLRDKVISRDVIIFGELGLGGELRPVQNGQQRIIEAAKHGFKTAIVPKANAPKKNPDNFTVIALDNISQLPDYI